MSSVINNMVSKLITSFFLIGFVAVLEISNSIAQDFPDPIQFDSSDMNPQVDVKFFLYTKDDPENPKQISLDDTDSLSNSGFVAQKPTKFVTHGWAQDGVTPGSKSSCVTAVRKGFLHHDFNVIVVDWKRIADLKPYPEAAKHVLGIAQYVGQMIDFVVKQGANPDEMTIAGHSLGGHIAGLAAYNATAYVGHVVAMDPAGPCFMKQGRKGRLSTADATLVETIHTATKTLGYSKPIGNVDYYPNGGESQPGDCQQKDKETKGFCSHLRACDYYGESLSNPQAWYAQRCPPDQWKGNQCKGNQIVPFARWTNKIERPPATYTLRTSNKAPFGKGRDGVAL